jgi:hypothetical protein
VCVLYSEVFPKYRSLLCPGSTMCLPRYPYKLDNFKIWKTIVISVILDGLMKYSKVRGIGYKMHVTMINVKIQTKIRIVSEFSDV